MTVSGIEYNVGSTADTGPVVVALTTTTSTGDITGYTTPE